MARRDHRQDSRPGYRPTLCAGGLRGSADRSGSRRGWRSRCSCRSEPERTERPEHTSFQLCQDTGGTSMSHRSRNVTIAILVLVAWAGFGVPAGARAQSGAASGSPDGLWRAVEPEVHALAAGPQRPPDWRGPDVFGLFTLQPDVLRRRLAGSKPHTLAAPKGAAAAVELSIPMPDGSFPRFRIEESAVLAPELAARYPALRTYRGQGIDD